MDINFQENNIEGLDLTDEYLEHANLIGAHLEGAHLEGRHLENAILTGAHLEGAHLEYAHLDDAHLQGAFLMGAHLQGAHLGDAFLEDAKLMGAHLQGAHLEDAKLMGAQLMGAHLEGAHLISAKLMGTDLSGAHLMGANLSWADLTGARLDNTDLTGAILDNTDFTGTFFAHLNYDELPPGYVPQPPFAGVAYEVHNAFATFQSKQNEYLTIIVQSDFKGVVANFPQFVNKKFKQNITEVFPGDDNKLTQFNNVFNKSKDSLGRLDPENLQLIYKSITFALSQDDNDFKVQYITTFLDETCNAYSGPGDNISCVKGILERFVLSVGNAVQNLCIAGCENKTYKELDILMNSKFIIEDAASSWWENEATEQEIIDMVPEKRKKRRNMADIIADIQPMTS